MLFFVQDSVLYVSYLVFFLCVLFLTFLVYRELIFPYILYRREINSIILKPVERGEEFISFLLKTDKLKTFHIGKTMGEIKTLCNEISESHLQFSFQQKKMETIEDRKYSIKALRNGAVLYKSPYDKYYSKMSNKETIVLSELLKKPALFRVGKSIVGKNRMLHYIELSLTASYLYELDENQKTQLQGLKYKIVIESIKPHLVKDKKDTYYDFETESEKDTPKVAQ